MTLVVSRGFQIPDTEQRAVRQYVYCPGCGALHAFTTNPFGGYTGPVWSWNGDKERPSFGPSLHVRLGHEKFCHSFVIDGEWQFLDDSWHHLAGKNVPMVPVPDWMYEK